TPEAQPFFKLELAGTECPIAGELKVEGSVNAFEPFYSTSTTNEEITANPQIFSVVNEESGGKGAVRQGYRSWEVEEGGTVKTGSAQLEFVEGTTKTAAPLEALEQVELTTASGKRGLLAVHE
ncbi:MAG: hypothetical protein ACYDHN_07055, partial [Solirubrobacteraceae bacterium]